VESFGIFVSIHIFSKGIKLLGTNLTDGLILCRFVLCITFKKLIPLNVKVFINILMWNVFLIHYLSEGIVDYILLFEEIRLVKIAKLVKVHLFVSFFLIIICIKFPILKSKFNPKLVTINLNRITLNINYRN